MGNVIALEEWFGSGMGMGMRAYREKRATALRLIEGLETACIAIPIAWI